MCVRGFITCRGNNYIPDPEYVARWKKHCQSIIIITIVALFLLGVVVGGTRGEYVKNDQVHQRQFTIHGYEPAGLYSDMIKALDVIDMSSGDGKIVELKPVRVCVPFTLKINNVVFCIVVVIKYNFGTISDW